MKKSLAVSLISTIVAILLATPATAAGSQRDELGINSGALVNHVGEKSPVGDSLDQVTWGYGFGAMLCECQRLLPEQRHICSTAHPYLPRQ